MEENEGKEEKIEIEVVTGDDNNLNISNVYDHLNLNKVRKGPEKKNIVIPVVKKEEKESDEDSNN